MLRAKPWFLRGFARRIWSSTFIFRARQIPARSCVGGNCDFRKSLAREEYALTKCRRNASAKTLVFPAFGAQHFRVSFVFSRATNAPAHLCRRKLRFWKVTCTLDAEVLAKSSVFSEEFAVRETRTSPLGVRVPRGEAARGLVDPGMPSLGFGRIELLLWL